MDIANEIAQALSDYKEEVTKGLEEAKEEIAKDTAKRLKLSSPNLTGDYAKGWRAKKAGNGWVVHNKTDYQLTHLLEHGHAKRGGGRVTADPHIGQAEDKAIQEYLDRMERVIRR